MRSFKKPTDIAEFLLKWSTIAVFFSAVSFGVAFNTPRLGEHYSHFFELIFGFLFTLIFFAFPIFILVMLLSLAFLIVDFFIEKGIEAQERQILRRAIDENERTD